MEELDFDPIFSCMETKIDFFLGNLVNFLPLFYAFLIAILTPLFPVHKWPENFRPKSFVSFYNVSVNANES